MMTDQQLFLTLLFDPEDKTCFAYEPTDTSLESVDDAIVYPRTRHPYFSINAMHTSRADKNVIKHRTFLVEFDSVPLEQQDLFMTLPYSAKVFSGNKSYHYFIVLEEPVSAEKYAELAQRIHMAVPKADKSTKNPSRLARLPEVVRPENGKTQILVWKDAIHRINNNTLDMLLPKLPVPYYEPNPADRELFVSTAILAAKHAPDEVMQQMRIEGRNNFFHWLGQRLIEQKLPKSARSAIVDECYANLRSKAGFGLREARAAARV